jgi:hypothetical protein
LLLDSILSHSFDSDTESKHIIGNLEWLCNEEFFVNGLIYLCELLQLPESPLNIVFGELASEGIIGMGLMKLEFRFLAEMLYY